MLGLKTATVRPIVSFAIAMVFLVPLKSATGTEDVTSPHGISASIVPNNARPGDVVEFRVEMNRDTWGRFELERPNHPRMRTIAEEKIPVSYQGQLYKQRHSVFLQPVSSGDIRIGATSITLSTAGGEQTVELPTLALRVQPFDSPALSDLPLPLPPGETAFQSPSIFSLLFWAGVALAVLGVWSFVFFGLQNRPLQSVRTESPNDFSETSDIVERLQSGVVAKDELENLLHDSSFSLSAELRSKIEQAVYSEQIELSELAILFQKELRP